jgi:cation transport regulator ChaB
VAADGIEEGFDMPVKDSDLPGTIKRSPAKAKRTYAKALESAEKQYGEGARARRVAIAALKHSFEKVGDHWEPKNGKGPSDAQAAKSGAAARRGGRTAGGVDVRGNSKQELYERAKKLGIKGRSRMSKQELGEAIGRRQ